ncbi:hypothetical protein [Bacteroides sp.]|uniref:hypothetical protein n=1 Tax=Bacteroides sp. TaxID=29523 RepID=UPI002607A81D|nr:hypothetical protein [Bacteroides sp.]MDD3039050.1 hypothetical protein [Bacteroides sp.]
MNQLQWRNPIMELITPSTEHFSEVNRKIELRAHELRELDPNSIEPAVFFTRQAIREIYGLDQL